jgi:hypothetical protein
MNSISEIYKEAMDFGYEVPEQPLEDYGTYQLWLWLEIQRMERNQKLKAIIEFEESQKMDAPEVHPGMDFNCYGETIL